MCCYMRGHFGPPSNGSPKIAEKAEGRVTATDARASVAPAQTPGVPVFGCRFWSWYPLVLVVSRGKPTQKPLLGVQFNDPRFECLRGPADHGVVADVAPTCGQH